MSFSASVKAELCHTPVGRACCARAELYGMLLFCSDFGHREIRIVSENADIIKRATILLRVVFGLPYEATLVGRKRQLSVTREVDRRMILTGLGYDYKNQVNYHLNRNLLEHECCPSAFLRGAFLMTGSVAEPEKKSHLEIKANHLTLSREVMSLMLDSGLNPKCTERDSAAVFYWKDTAQIEDLLTLLGAPRASLSIMEAKVEKNMRNNINRQVNCETANLMKTTDASARQIAAIEKALAERGLEIFPESLRQTVDLRVANPSASLSELAAMFQPPLSKPGINHRLKRIMEIATEGE